MSTSDHPPKNVPAISGRRYSNITEMLAGEGVSPEVQTKFNTLSQETRITRCLAKLRARHGLTQEAMGEKVGMSQSAISKLEAGRDEDLTLADIRKYANAFDERIGVVFGKPIGAVEAIKLHALGMRRHMLELAELAAADTEMDRAVQAFFGEAFFNILDILSTCQAKMPNGVEGCEIRMEVISSKPIITRADASSSPVHLGSQVLV
jgi:transcriptional regulator with XRE-family HTH domain